ncbi:Hypothetical protein CINCED_3A007549, partial [Cinara cedri]
GKRRLKEETAPRVKKAWMDQMKTLGFIEIDSAFSRKIVWYYLKNIESTYYKPQVDNSTVNRAFKTSARPIFPDTDIKDDRIRDGFIQASMQYANNLTVEDYDKMKEDSWIIYQDLTSGISFIT